MMTFIPHSRRFNKSLPVDQIHPVALLLLPTLLLSFSFPYWIYRFDQTAALPDPGIWSLLLLALTVFLLLLIICWYLFNKSWARLKLPGIDMMVSHFKQLELWQQIVLYWASFALVLLTAVGCLAAVF